MQVAVESEDDQAVSGRCGLDRRHHADEFTAIQAGLARLIEGEILPSLARSLPRLHEQPAAVTSPTPERVAAFARSLAVRDLDEAEVTALADEGLPLATLLLDLFAPAARHLGAMWEEDEADFVDVTLGLGRLHAVRAYAMRSDGAGARPADRASCPAAAMSR